MKSELLSLMIIYLSQYQKRTISRLLENRSFLTSHELFIEILKTVVPRRSNRRPDGAQPRKQHSDRALSLMLLGDFETAGFAGSKRRLRSSYASPPQLAGDCGVWHGKKVLA